MRSPGLSGFRRSLRKFFNFSLDTHEIWKDKEETHRMGFISIGSAQGYGGRIKVAVAVDLKGEVINLLIIEHKETAAFLRRVLNKEYTKSIAGKKYSDSFVLGEDLDGVTGATFTCRALAQAVREGSRKIAVEILGFPPIPESPLKIKFGYPEAFLIFLFLALTS